MSFLPKTINELKVKARERDWHVIEKTEGQYNILMFINDEKTGIGVDLISDNNHHYSAFFIANGVELNIYLSSKDEFEIVQDMWNRLRNGANK